MPRAGSGPGWRFGRRPLDLTPFLDVIMILLFGVMVHSVRLVERGTADARLALADAERSSTAADDRSQSLASRLDSAEETIARLSQRAAAAQRRADETELARIRQRDLFTETASRLLALDPQERQRLEDRLAEPARLPERLLADADATDRFRALRRVAEMQKVFTFVDAHLDAGGFLSLRANGRILAVLPVRGSDAAEIERRLRRTLESVSFSDNVLVLYSYDGAASDFAVEDVGEALDRLIAAYRDNRRDRLFRLGVIGLLEQRDTHPQEEEAQP